MQAGISTHVFLPQRLHPGLLDALQRSGAQTIELFAARHHFDYTDRGSVREIATWFRSNEVAATLHQPIYLTDRADTQWSRHVEPNLNLIDPEKSRRIDAMDEVKRALECAEQIPVSTCVLHLGQKDDQWDLRALENSLTTIEHLKAFAHPLGVQLLLENLQNEITSPEHLLEIVRVGHFDNIGFCLDVGHAQLDAPENNAGVDAAFQLLKPRIAELHVHDNGGLKDDHLWPGSGSVDWTNLVKHIATLPSQTAGILEISYELGESAETVEKKAVNAFDLIKRAEEKVAQ